MFPEDSSAEHGFDTLVWFVTHEVIGVGSFQFSINPFKWNYLNVLSNYFLVVLDEVSIASIYCYSSFCPSLVQSNHHTREFQLGNRWMTYSQVNFALEVEFCSFESTWLLTIWRQKSREALILLWLVTFNAFTPSLKVDWQLLLECSENPLVYTKMRWCIVSIASTLPTFVSTAFL